MAMQNEVQVGRYQHLLERLLSMKGEIAQQQLAPEILPILVLESERPEWKALANERLCVGGAFAAATVGQFSVVQLWNPAPARTLVVVDSLIVNPQQAGFILLSHWDTGASGGSAVAGSRGFRDGRLPRGGASTAALTFGYTNAARPGTSIASLYFSAAPFNSQVIPLSFVLTPGRGLAVESVVVNNAISAYFNWRERKIEDSEASVGT